MKQEHEKDILHYKKSLREWWKTTEEMSNDYEKQLVAKDAKIQKLKDELNKAYKNMNLLYKEEADQKATLQILRNRLQDEQMMYYAQEHKGHEGIKGTPIEHSTNTLVHDHERTFYSYGENHQECLVHYDRYLKSSMQNESHLSWNKRMYDTLQEMMQYVNHTSVRDKKKIEELIRAYDRAIEISKINYKEHSPDKYYPDGYNLAKRMDEYRDNHIFFLLNEGIPYENNKSERYARVIKRKLRQMITFRSFESFENTCASIGMIESLRLQGGNLVDKIIKIFDEKKGSLGNL